MKCIKLGSKVRCIFSGFTGVAVARVEFINGCVQYSVLPKCGKDGKMPEALEIDSESLEVISNKKKKIVKKETGGPMRKSELRRGF